MRSKATFAILLIPIAFLVVAYASGVIPNLTNPRPYIYTAGQPDEEGFRQVSKMGVKTVINVLPERNCMPGEQELVTSNAMVYRSVPFQISNLRIKRLNILPGS